MMDIRQSHSPQYENNGLKIKNLAISGLMNSPTQNNLMRTHR